MGRLHLEAPSEFRIYQVNNLLPMPRSTPGELFGRDFLYERVNEQIRREVCGHKILNRQQYEVKAVDVKADVMDLGDGREDRSDQVTHVVE